MAGNGSSSNKRSQKRDIKISFDMNYRPKMWSIQEAKQVYEQILPYTDYLSAGKLDAINFMGVSEIEGLDWKYYTDRMAQIYPNIEYIYGTNRIPITPNSYNMTGYIRDNFNSKSAISKEYENHVVVDRVGTGDSYAAAILDGIILGKSLKETVEFAIAASALKHTVYGDINPFSREEIEQFMFNTDDILR